MRIPRALLRWSVAGAVVGALLGGMFQDVGAQPPILVTGAGPGGGPHVRVFDAATGQPRFEFYAYDPMFTGGVSVAAADVNNDGVPDVMTSAGPGGGPHVRVFDGAALLNNQIVELYGFMAYNVNFTGGVFVAAGNAGGRPDRPTGPDRADGPDGANWGHGSDGSHRTDWPDRRPGSSGRHRSHGSCRSHRSCRTHGPAGATRSCRTHRSCRQFGRRFLCRQQWHPKLHRLLRAS